MRARSSESTVASLNVLVTAGSRRVPLVEAFQRALRELNVEGSVIVTDVNGLSPAVHVADRAYAVSLSSSATYLSEVIDICQTEKVGLLIPTIDEELPRFGAARGRFSALGVTVFTSSQQTALRCNDKFETCRLLRAGGVSAAESFRPEDLPTAPSFPLFVKPRYGRGSVGAFCARNTRELDFFLSYVEEPVVQEYLDGSEYTIDLLCDLDARPIAVVPRERLVIRAGVSDRGRTCSDPRLIELALACAEVFEFRGAVNIQCRMNADGPVVFEINPRYSGGIPLTIAAGVDFPRLMVEMALGRHVAPAIGEFDADRWMTSYETTMFFSSAELDVQELPPMSRLQEAV